MLLCIKNYWVWKMKNNVLIIEMHPAPYRDPVINQLILSNKGIDVINLYSYDKGHKEWKLNKENVGNIYFKHFPVIGDFHFGLFKIAKRYSTVLVPGWFPISLLFVMFGLLCLKKKVVFSCDTVSCKKDIYHGLIFSLLRKCGSFFVPGERTKKFLINIVGIPSGNVYKGSYMIDTLQWVNSVSHEKERRESLRRYFNIDSSQYVYLFIGKLVRNRNIPLLVNSFMELDNKNSILIIIGDGEYYKNDIYNAQKKLGKRLIHIEQVGYNELAKFYAIADCYVHPGSEPYSLATVQAVLGELPVVANIDVGCVDDYINNGYNGLVINSDNIDDMKSGMEKIRKLQRRDIENAAHYARVSRNVDWAKKELEAALGLYNSN